MHGGELARRSDLKDRPPPSAGARAKGCAIEIPIGVLRQSNLGPFPIADAVEDMQICECAIRGDPEDRSVWSIGSRNVFGGGGAVEITVPGLKQPNGVGAILQAAE